VYECDDYDNFYIRACDHGRERSIEIKWHVNLLQSTEHWIEDGVMEYTVLPAFK
jgi:hypothetical protein